MKAFFNWLLDKIIAPIITGLVIFIVTSIGSKASTGNWLMWFTTIPKPVWVTVATLLVLWILASAIHRRIKHLRKENWSPPKPLRWESLGGWENIFPIKYAGVIWNVRVPVETSTFKRRVVLTLSALDIEIPPRCPDCGTKLEQAESFWGRYVWKCLNCRFHKRNRDNFSKEERRVIKLAERRFEEIQQSQVENGQ
jgi:hypothetical protein